MKTHSSYLFTITITAALLPFLVGGCGNGGGNSTSSSPFAIPPGASEAFVWIELSSNFMSRSGVRTEIIINEGNGLGLSIMCLEITYGTSQVSKFATSDLIRSYKETRVEAFGKLETSFISPTNWGKATEAELNYLDDRGNLACRTSGLPVLCIPRPAACS